MLNVVHVGKTKNNRDFPQGLAIIAEWGNLPISMVLRFEGSLNSEMLSLARTAKYVDNTSVLSINKTDS